MEILALYVFSDFPFDGFSIQFKGHDLYARIHNNAQGLYRSNMLMTRKYCLRSVMSFLCSQNLRKSHKLWILQDRKQRRWPNRSWHPDFRLPSCFASAPPHPICHYRNTTQRHGNFALLLCLYRTCGWTLRRFTKILCYSRTVIIWIKGTWDFKLTPKRSVSVMMRKSLPPW